MVDREELVKKEKRNQELEEDKSLTFEIVVDCIDDAIRAFSQQDFVGGGVSIGWLRRAIIEHRDLFKE